MDSIQAYTEYNKARKEYNNQYSLKCFFQNQISNFNNDKNYMVKQKNLFNNQKVSLERSLRQVNDIIVQYSKLNDDINLSNQSIQNIQNLFQDSISCDCIATSNLFEAFKIQDITSDQSLVDLKKEKYRLEESINQLKKDLIYLESKINTLQSNINNFESLYNQSIQKMSIAENNMIYYKQYI